MKKTLIIAISSMIVLSGCFQDNTELQNKITKLEAQVDSLENIIHPKKKAKAASKKSATKKKSAPKVITISDTKSLIEKVDEYIKLNENAREYKVRGKVVIAKETEDKANSLKKKIERMFKKGKIVTLIFDKEHPITQNYLFQTDRWKLRYYYFNEVKPDGKKKEWWSSKRNSIKAENFKTTNKYRVKFKVLEDIQIPYGGTMSFFSLNLKFVDIDQL